MRSVVNDDIKTTRKGNNKFPLLLKSMTATHLTAGNIVYPISTFNLEGNMVLLLNKRKVAPWIFKFR